MDLDLVHAIVMRELSMVVVLHESMSVVVALGSNATASRPVHHRREGRAQDQGFTEASPKELSSPMRGVRAQRAVGHACRI